MCRRAVGFSWVLSEQKKEKLLLRQEQEKLGTKYVKLNELLSGDINIGTFATEVSRENMQEEPVKYQEKKVAVRSDILTASITCAAMGLTISVGWLLLFIVHGVSELLKRIRLFFISKFGHQKKEGDNQLIEAGSEKDESISQTSKTDRLVRAKGNFITQNELYPHCRDKESEKIDMLYCDEKSFAPEEQTNEAADFAGINVKRFDRLEQNIRKTILSDYHQNVLRVESSLKAQNENLEKQVSEVRQMAKTIKEAATGNSEPVKNTLDELTKQVSAIREYASFQQDRIKKLQEGYDWNIIRTFCLRVIRCIDNLENRISTLSVQGRDTTDLEEIKDELIFALESSGVEPFKPEVNSDFSGKEKIAEVVKDRAYTDNAGVKGKIAEVVRPGYQYVIDDGNVKVVRMAQVRLFC